MTRGNDTTDFTSSFSQQQQQQQQRLALAADPITTVASDSTLVSSSSLADSLTEFAGVLGSPPGLKEGAEQGAWLLEGADGGQDMGEDMYNPFDSNGEFC